MARNRRNKSRPVQAYGSKPNGHSHNLCPERETKSRDHNWLQHDSHPTPLGKPRLPHSLYEMYKMYLSRRQCENETTDKNATLYRYG